MGMTNKGPSLSFITRFSTVTGVLLICLS